MPEQRITPATCDFLPTSVGSSIKYTHVIAYNVVRSTVHVCTGLNCNIFINTNVNKYNNCNNLMPRPVPHNRMQIKERRENTLVLLTRGMKGYEIAKELGVDASTVSRD